ncbi:hypothetical protein SLEP1_g42889 [Rubroshorea leprosula]|uniref:Uncharacterized protein n=1 Tax=Rubroshorea leprosula TaxID=152421 RepID=A0AAV5LB78_9ROSI|nr:hypothetical protein SLEP1_g42889 [Rubroshorea leprosula]
MERWVVGIPRITSIEESVLRDEWHAGEKTRAGTKVTRRRVPTRPPEGMLSTELSLCLQICGGASVKSWRPKMTCSLSCGEDSTLGLIRPLFMCQILLLQYLVVAPKPRSQRYRAKNFVQQNGGSVAMLKLMDGASKKARTRLQAAYLDEGQVEDKVNRLPSSEMANKVASTESWVEELANQVTDLKAELERAQAEKESRILAPQQEQWLKQRECFNDPLTLLAPKEWSGVEWLVESGAFQDVLVIASMNTTMQIYDDVQEKVLKHRPYFPISELTFIEAESIDENGKSLLPPFEMAVRVGWNSNKDGVPIFPPVISKDGEDGDSLPSCKACIARAPDAKIEEAITSKEPKPVIAPVMSQPASPRIDAVTTMLAIDLIED